MKTVQLGKKTIDFATSWNEASMDQIVALLPLQLVDPGDAGQAALLKYSAATILLGNPRKELAKLTTEQRWRLMMLASWVLTKRIEHKPFDFFTFQGVDYYLPEVDFANTSAIEIAFTNIQFMALGRAKNPDPLAIFQLIATLCRPIRNDLAEFKASKDWTGDSRETYNTVLSDERAKLFQALPVGVAMAVLQYFEWMNGRFMKAYAKAYEADPDDDEAPLYTDGRGLITTFMDIGKAGVFGDFEKVCATNSHTVWLYLVDNNLKIKRANRRAERDREGD